MKNSRFHSRFCSEVASFLSAAVWIPPQWKMNFLLLYFVVSAISLVKCKLQHDVRNLSDESNELDIVNQTGFQSLDELKGLREDGVHEIKNIFLECKTKIEKNWRKIIRSEVKSRVSGLKSYLLAFYQCVKVFGFRFLDKVLEEDVIPVTDYVYFVKDSSSEGRSRTSRELSLRDYATQVLSKKWTVLAYNRLDDFFRTHSLKFHFPNSLVHQGRSRRRDHRIFAVMVMGFMIMASILIPMGFQFLTVLGGKSLLLAKMALIMSAINGLKKIAASNVGYGFYHSAGDAHHHDHLHHGFHEKLYQNHNLQGYN